MNPTQGVLYVATGKKYIQAAIKSAFTVQHFCPGLPIQIFCDWQNYDVFHFDRSTLPFTSVQNIPDPHRRSKVDYLSKTPFDQTLYLDTDTAFNADVREMFQILERFDVGIAHAHRRNDSARLGSWRLDLPQAFPQFNSGVFLYRKTPSVIQFMDDWGAAFREAGFQQDQMTLRELLWTSDLRIATLPPEYNVRFLKFPMVWTKSEAIPKIYHLQLYHDGPLWFIKNGFKRSIRTLLRWLGTSPAKLRNLMKNEPES